MCPRPLRRRCPLSPSASNSNSNSNSNSRSKLEGGRLGGGCIHTAPAPAPAPAPSFPHPSLPPHPLASPLLTRALPAARPTPHRLPSITPPPPTTACERAAGTHRTPPTASTSPLQRPASSDQSLSPGAYSTSKYEQN
ncbi:hypothetical protein C8Q78DRAFT_194267 [Trametes maxima]|nr:hypothetical protein C8Q78DRAFT_194267 [Trametes maxima]